MAGTPTARGCDACRRQKKKCDQAKPKCSRCTRLGIQCIGSGEKRYIFKQERIRDSSTSSSSTPEAHLVKRLARTMTVSRTPSNETVRRGNAFISILEVADIRYAISSFGDLLVHVPSRLGRNPGLDASIHALTVGYGSYRTGNKYQEALASLRSATQALRMCFENPTTAFVPETLCAMYICTIAQSFIFEADDTGASSAEMMAQIMKAAIYQPWQPGFDAELLTVMCMPVILESLFNPNIELEPWIWKLVEMYEPIRTPGPRLAAPFESLHVRSIVRFAVNMRNPPANILQIQTAYQQMRIDMVEVRKALIGIDAAAAGMDQTSLDWAMAMKALSRIQAGYCMVLTMALMSNQLLQNASLGHSTLTDDAQNLHQEILRSSRDACRFRPFGASAQPYSLVAVVATSDDEFVKAQARELVLDYAADFPMTNWAEIGMQIAEKLDRVRQM